MQQGSPALPYTSVSEAKDLEVLDLMTDDIGRSNLLCYHFRISILFFFPHTPPLASFTVS